MLFLPAAAAFRHQTRYALRIVARDRSTRCVWEVGILCVCWYAGHGEAAAMLAGVFVVLEFLAWLFWSLLPDEDHRIPLWIVVGFLTNNVVSTVIHLTPSVLLAAQPSIALLLGGFLWLFAVYVHVTNSYHDLPIFNWSMMVPSLAAGLVVFWQVAQTDYVASSALDWGITIFIMCCYAGNTMLTMLSQRELQRALEIARAEADARLRELEFINRHDALTGLLNRRALDADLGRLLQTADAADVAIFLMDLDGFKPINDTYSHAAGDAVLTAVAGRLREVAGARGLAARLGGDEFALVMTGVRSAEFALKIAARLSAAVAEPIPYGEKALVIGTSIGIALVAAGEAGLGVGGLCARADQAMYRAKAGTGQKAVIYEPDAFPPRLSLEDRRILSEALRNREIVPHYQPKVRLDSGGLIGFEALARWNHPTRGLLFPRDFLPQINELGLQGEFSATMVARVLEEVSSLVDEGLDPGQVSVNLPEVTLATHSGRDELDALLARHPAAQGRLTFEITEDVFIARSGDIIKESVAHFRRAGIRISLDDFGTGFASFQHLRQLQFDELKIDGSFVAALGHDPAAEVLIRGFLSIASGLGVLVIAEGVETRAQVGHLRRMGCVFAQGWHFSRSIPFEEARARLIAQSGDSPGAEPAPLRRSG